jgi:colicin import membrane protein
MTDTLSRNIVFSLGGHLAVILIIFFKAVVFPGEPIELRTAIRVDVVGLPEKIDHLELKPMAESPPEPVKKPALPPKEVKAEPVVKPVPVVLNKKSKKDFTKAQQEALNKLKSQDALAKIKEQMKEGEKSDKPAKPSTVVKGNAVNEGNSLTGLEKIDFDRYLQDVKERILSQWSIPEWMADAKLKAQVLVLIDDRGYVVRKAFRRSSGNVVFDETVTSAIDASSPLPAPPARLKGQLESRGIVFNFPE